MRGRSTPSAVISAGVVIVVGAIAVAILPPVQARGKAALTLAEALGADVPRPLAPMVVRQEARFAGTDLDLYLPAGPAPAIVIVPGAAPAGRADPRVRRLAYAMARADRVVAVPELDLFGGYFTERDLGRLAELVADLPNHRAVRGSSGVVLVGFSFGGAFVLLTAADERARSQVRLIVTFGAYADLVGMIQAATTGVAVVGRERHPWTPPPEARVALERLAFALAPLGEEAQVMAALRTDAAMGAPEQGTGGEDDGAEEDAGNNGLSPEARTVIDLITNKDPDRTREMVARLPATAQARLRAFSPVSVAGQIAAPVLSLHAQDDPAVPAAELSRLSSAIPQARTVTVGSFTHVDPRGNSDPSALVDLRRIWAAMTSILSAQEDWFD